MIEKPRCKFWKVMDKKTKEVFEVFEGAPCGEAEGRGATHLILTEEGVVAARMVKGFVYVEQVSDLGFGWRKVGVKVLGEDNVTLMLDYSGGRNRFKVGKNSDWEGIVVRVEDMPRHGCSGEESVE